MSPVNFRHCVWNSILERIVHGVKIHRRMEGLKDAAAKVLRGEGSCTKSLSELAFRPVYVHVEYFRIYLKRILHVNSANLE
ncbi:hypothetical protein ACSBR1_017303 [Camellia fascicularis]